MSSAIMLGDQYLYISNRSLSHLIFFALIVAKDRADGHEFARRLRVFEETEYFPGCTFDLVQRFPTIEERKFWTACFYDVARRVFLRELGNHEDLTWQTWVIGNAYVVARMLQRSVQEVEGPWSPFDEKTTDGSINIRA